MYQIAIYIRLSKEDDKFREESNSITMQRIFLKKYVADNFVDYDLLEFCDDGYTGTNFERPGIKNMLKSVRNNEINCIVVKDFSRFARDYIELGTYIEQIFPFMGVRFISVNDRYDSKDYQGNIADMGINFKNLMYDLYSKDLSRKVRSSLKVRKEQGQYISANSPFGYEKDLKDRHTLLVAEDEAEVVRQIFSLTLKGYTSSEIARFFNENSVKTPIEFKIEKGKTNRTPKGEMFLWSSGTICRILRNEMYIGNIVQKKYTKDYVGGKNHLNPHEEWIVSYNHHEPIIDREVFDKVQKGRGLKRKLSHKPAHPLVGKVVCGCCKKNLYCRTGVNSYFTCNYRYSNTMKNCVNRINTILLEQYVLFMMHNRLQKNGELEKLRSKELCRLDNNIKELKKKRNLISAKIQRIKQKNFDSYQDYVYGKAYSFNSEENLIKAANEEIARLNKSIQEIEEQYNNIEFDNLSGKTQFMIMSKDMIEHYIDKILVYNERHIEIIWK